VRILFLELPSPPRLNVYRDFLGFGVASPSERQRYGHEGHVVPPLHSAYAAALLEESDHEVSVLDAQVRNLDLPDVLQEVEKLGPDIVVSRLSLPAFKQDLEILNQVSEACPGAHLVAWGTICAVAPVKAIAESSVHITIQGELEFTLPDVVKGLEAGSLEGAVGICFRHGGKIVQNQRRPFETNLDSLPIPAYHLLDMDRYLIEEGRFYPESEKGNLTRFFSVLSSRGCSYNCVYCPYPIGSGRPWRGMSARRTVDEIEHLVRNYDVHGIWFRDQTFSMDMARASKICDEILERRLRIRWTCETRADRISRELARKMRQSGCVSVNIGVETGDPRILAIVGKRGASVEKIAEAFKVTREEGLRRRAFVLIGLPGESWQSIEKTRRLIDAIDPDVLTVDIVTPYPGTALYEMAEDEGWLITKDWARYTSIDPVMSFKNFRAEDMRNARRYLLDQRYARRRIQRISTLVKQGRIRLAAREIQTIFADTPHNLQRVSNMIRHRLK